MRAFVMLGAGVQSSIVTALAAVKDKRLIDALGGVAPEAAAFADPGNEDEETYEYLDRHLLPFVKREGFEVAIVSAGSKIHEDILASRGPGNRTVPVSTPSFLDSGSKNGGTLNRTCTDIYKVRPVNTWLRERCGRDPEWLAFTIARRAYLRDAKVWVKRAVAAGHKFSKDALRIGFLRGFRPLTGLDQPPPPPPAVIRKAIGISLDEAAMRMKDSTEPWSEWAYPLTEMKWTRFRCEDEFARFGLPVPPKSACVICPFRGNDSWREMKRRKPASFEQACSFDEGQREVFNHHPSLRSTVYLHRSLKPLRMVDFDNGQCRLFDGFSGDCGGLCGT